MTTNVIPLTTGVATVPSATWLDYRHPEWTTRNDKWVYAREHYQGDVSATDVVKSYLRRRSVGEAEVSYQERCDLADYTNHFGAVVDSIAGMLFAIEGSANRVFNKVTDGEQSDEVLGDPADRSTPIGRLYADADGAGTGYLTTWKLLATDLLVSQMAWVMVDPGNDGETPHIRVFPATSVVNWRHDAFGLSEVLFEEVADTRASIRDEITLEYRYILFTREGWQRYRRKDGNTVEEMVGAENTGEYSFVDRDGNAALPIFPVELKLRRMIGWQLAKKSNAIFNMESQRDYLLRVANSPKMVIVGSDAMYDTVVDQLTKGANALQSDPTEGGAKSHHWIAPDTEPAKTASEVLKRKVEEFWVTAFRMYGDSAKERQTATEVRQDVSSGVGAFLQMLKAAIDDAENQALWRIEQVVHPNDPSKHFVCRVERSEDFLPTDVDQAIERMRERYFGQGQAVPIGRAAMVEAAKQMLHWDGVQSDPKEIQAAVDAWIASQPATKAQLAALPPTYLAHLLKRTLESTGDSSAAEATGAELQAVHKAAVTPKPAVVGSADAGQRE
jgi:hypothetical protein